VSRNNLTTAVSIGTSSRVCVSFEIRADGINEGINLIGGALVISDINSNRVSINIEGSMSRVTWLFSGIEIWNGPILSDEGQPSVEVDSVVFGTARTSKLIGGDTGTTRANRDTTISLGGSGRGIARTVGTGEDLVSHTTIASARGFETTGLGSREGTEVKAAISIGNNSGRRTGASIGVKDLPSISIRRDTGVSRTIDLFRPS